MEEMRTFKPFELKTISGEARTLSDFLGRVTFVALFFPT